MNFFKISNCLTNKKYTLFKKADTRSSPIAFRLIKRKVIPIQLILRMKLKCLMSKPYQTKTSINYPGVYRETKTWI